MSRALRLRLLFVGLAGFALFFCWGLRGLPPVGDYRGPYGDVVSAVAGAERHATDIVSAITYDYRGFDTMGEEFILFASVTGVVMLLRRSKDEQSSSGDDAGSRTQLKTSDAIQILGLALIGVSVTFGLYVVTHGQLTPGGGFQAGVILATVPLLVYLAGDPRKFLRIAPRWLVEFSEAGGAAAFIFLGSLGLVWGVEFMRNVIPLGPYATIVSSGLIPLVSLATGFEVAGGFVLLLSMFLEEMMERRIGGRK